MPISSPSPMPIPWPSPMPSPKRPHPSSPPQRTVAQALVRVLLCGLVLSARLGHAQASADPSRANPQVQPDTRADIPRSQAPTPPPVPLQLNTHFAGDWAGTLEYRDYSASSPDAPHTRLPTTLIMRPSPDGRAINFAFTYNDGPGKTVRERTILAFTDDTALITGTASAQNQAFHVQGLDTFRATGFGTLVLTGTGKESDKPVEIRQTLTLQPGQFTWSKETRPAKTDGPFVFRDQYSFTPVALAPPAAATP